MKEAQRKSGYEQVGAETVCKSSQWKTENTSTLMFSETKKQLAPFFISQLKPTIREGLCCDFPVRRSANFSVNYCISFLI